ncbi:ABC transporter ATP-binding protein [Paracraurococcus ruber]|uniref:ABC transporter ATP-binding protein n=1 Tax=Paracraurococcus ruber TaxID=77675 RepID=A0ABS1CSB8_9PROT|nr:ABC transporter ATP-binding protein [Paracraurococcus ruber]MBK1657264.1 ABC transporter ATP-binding protein [Paracraurococcus ruber]TDG33152.1 ABC transporter ATP-binding protein [Paracraurococcus ruber]
MLEITGLDVHYGQAHVLQGVSLSLGAEPVAVIGRNGMGKTTLCQAVMGMLPASGGSVRLGGEEMLGRPANRVARAGIALVPQGRRVFPSLTVDEHLRLVSRGRGARWTIERVYETFPRLAERRRNGGTQLSGGEQQMLAIGRALLTNPRLVIMDEPSEGLAPVIVDHLVEVLRALPGEGIGLLLVEQNLGVATDVCGTVAVMVNGRIAATMPSRALLADEAAQRRFLGVSTGAQH